MKEIFYLITIIVIVLFISFMVLPIIVAIKLAKNSHKKDKLNADDFNRNKIYYREILDRYSPSILAYMDTMQVNYSITIISTLLYLKNKNYIDIIDNTIVKKVENFNNKENLGRTEKLIFDNIKDNQVKIEKDTINNIVLQDAIDKKIVVADYNRNKEKIKNKIRIFVIIFIILLFLNFFINNESLFGEIIQILCIFLLPIFFITGIIYFFSYVHKNNENPIYRTDLGIEINKKLEGLKNYISEYSIMDKRNVNELDLWEDYLIYSVIFNQNKKIADEYSKFIKNDY